MLRICTVVFIIIGGLFLNVNSYGFKQPLITVSTNKASTVVGSVFKLEIKVTAEKNAAISWDQCDELFKQSQYFIFLKINDLPYANGSFTHQIYFTSLKPINKPIKELPILVNNWKYPAPNFVVEFKADKIAPTISNIKPVVNTTWTLILKATVFCLSLILGLLAVSYLVYLLIVKWIKVKTPQSFKNASLNKLSELELQIQNENVNSASLVDEIIALLTEYLVDDHVYSHIRLMSEAENEGLIKFNKIIDWSHELKFLPLLAMRQLYPDFVNSARDLIANYQPKTIR